ncbi:phosphonate ABC transporter, permease protein PhnE [Bacillus fonticola]|uniref:phosphonate ABC transporter, permease protein PhnE n=1 Tax=Bacillus fonticola TaxID=2728853 RepID=UPI001475DED3|nr:phosphonate ABC transporter, permease protein PhnE [Bacillus fonticola]
MAQFVLPPKPKRSPLNVAKRWMIWLIIAFLYVWTFLEINIDWAAVSERFISSLDRIIPRLFSPDFSATGEILLSMLETIFIAFAGSLTAAVIAIPLGFWAAANIGRSQFATALGKWFLSAVRAFPDLILAILFIVAVGANPFAGVLAIAIGATGMLGKLYSEVIESIDMNIVETMEASGAGKLQILFKGVIPQVIPEFLSYAIYRFEIDIRASTILGIVGAGGIGTMIQFAQMNRNWEEMGMILLVVIVVVIIIDYLSSMIRRRIV